MRMHALSRLGGAVLLATAAMTPAYLAAQDALFLSSATPAVPAMLVSPTMMSSAPLGPTVTGRPFSAVEQRHSLQLLGDGTRIEHTDTNPYFRDSAGRTRVEMKSGASAMVAIYDPVAGYTVMLNPADRTAHKLPLPGGNGAKMMASAGATGIATAALPAPVLAGQRVELQAEFGAAESESRTADSEDLGTQFLNGVSAQGSRRTVAIPAGRIGNDREIRIVSERWYSAELQVAVKTTSSDPRTGETTYELVNISRAEPDPALFTIPNGYSESQPKVIEYKALPNK